MAGTYNNYNRYSSYNDYNNGSNAYKVEEILPESRITKRHEPLTREVKSSHKATKKITALTFIRIVFGSSVMVAAACALIYFNTNYTSRQNKIIEKQNYYNDLVRENDDLKNELIKNVDIQDIRRKAKKLGMKQAGSKNIKYYSMKDEEFVLQIEDFPNK